MTRPTGRARTPYPASRLAAAVVVALLAAGLTGCAGPGDPGSTTHVVLLGPTPSATLLDELSGAYEQGHPGVDVHTVLAPTGDLDQEVRSQNASIDVILTDDPAVLDGLGSRVAGRRTLGHGPAGGTLVAATLSDSQHSDLGGDLVRWLTTTPARRLLAAHGWR